MPRFVGRILVAIVIGAAAALSQLGVAAAGGPGVWTKFAVTTSGGNQAGMFRTADGALHLVWQKQNSDHTFSYMTTTFSLTGKLQGSGTALARWVSLEGDPRLVRDGSGIRLVLLGGRTTNPADFFSRGAVYTETSTDGGNTWSLVHGSMSQHTVLNLGLAATADATGTPVAAFGLNSTLYFHKGVDPNAPASSPDGMVNGATKATSKSFV